MGLISEETIQRVAEANDIVDVIGSYFPLKRAGTSFRALCPFHREKSPSFHVNPARQSFHCFGCGAGGGVLRFVMDYEHVDFPTAVKRLGQRAGVPVIEEAGGPDDNRQHGLRQRLLALHAEAAEWFHRKLLKAPEGETARAYLKSRGIGGEIAKSWQLGYAPDSWDAILDHLRERKFSQEEITQSGLASAKDESDGGGKIYSRFRDRVMFPIRNDYGEVVAFSGRVLDPEAKAAKYVNSPETPLFTKGRVLYGLDKTKRDLINEKSAIVCEGQLDLISAFEAGVRNVIAPQGTAFTGDQARLLSRFVETVLLCFDSDSAGQQAVARSLPALLSNGLDVKVVELPAGEDPDSFLRSRGAEAFRELVGTAKNFFRHSVDRARAHGELGDAAGVSKLVKRLGPPLALVSDAAMRDSLVVTLTTDLAIPRESIRQAMKAPAPDPGEASRQEPVRRLESIPLSQGLAMLCRLALIDGSVRTWLLEQPPAAEIEPGGHLLDVIVKVDGQEPEGAVLHAVVSELGEVAERTLSALETRHSLVEPLSRAQQIWTGLLVQRLKEKMEGLKNSLGQAGLTAEDRSKIQKQILDLKIKVADVFRPS